MQSSQTIIPISLGFVKSFIIKGEKSIIVDAGIKGSSDKILAAMKANGVKPEDVSLIIITHAHTDHYGGLGALKNYISAPVAVHESEAEFLKSGTSAPVNLHGILFRIVKLFFKSSNISRVAPDVLIGDKFELGGYGVDGTVIHTPGHTAGSVSIILSGGEVIVGDMFGGKADGSAARLPAIYYDLDALKRSIATVIAANPERIHTSHGGIYSPEAAAKLILK